MAICAINQTKRGAKMSTFNKEDIAGLTSMGFELDEIKKLLSMSKEQFEELMPQTKPKRQRMPSQFVSSPSVPRPRRNDEVPILYHYTCRMCGNITEHEKQVVLTTLATYKVQYINQKRVIKQTTIGCKHCRTYLSAKTKSELIDIILGTKQIVPCIPDMFTVRFEEWEDEEIIENTEQQLMLRLWDKPESVKYHFPIVLVDDQMRWMNNAIKGLIEII